MDDLRMPEEWERELGILVVDPDGWRNTHTPWDTMISLDEFMALSGPSTIVQMDPTPVVESITAAALAIAGPFRGLSRLQSVITAWKVFSLSLDIVDHASKGYVRRYLTGQIRDLQRPATIKVASERGPLR